MAYPPNTPRFTAEWQNESKSAAIATARAAFEVKQGRGANNKINDIISPIGSATIAHTLVESWSKSVVMETHPEVRSGTFPVRPHRQSKTWRRQGKPISERKEEEKDEDEEKQEQEEEEDEA